MDEDLKDKLSHLSPRTKKLLAAGVIFLLLACFYCVAKAEEPEPFSPGGLIVTPLEGVIGGQGNFTLGARASYRFSNHMEFGLGFGVAHLETDPLSFKLPGGYLPDAMTHPPRSVTIPGQSDDRPYLAFRYSIFVGKIGK